MARVVSSNAAPVLAELARNVAGTQKDGGTLDGSIARIDSRVKARTALTRAFLETVPNGFLSYLELAKASGGRLLHVAYDGYDSNPQTQADLDRGRKWSDLYPVPVEILKPKGRKR